MKVVIVENYEQMSQRAAELLAAQLKNKPNLVIGLATGSTPLGFYKELCQLHQRAGVDFSQATSFNLDEYCGIKPDNPQSYHRYMKEKLFNHVNFDRERTYLPKGDAVDLEAEGVRYEQLIEASGGIDLQILGVGQNGHIGFNEPGQCFDSVTGVVQLAQQTIAVNAGHFESEAHVPRAAISMGIKSIMRARSIVLMASGRLKAEVVYQTVFGRVTTDCPSTVLQLHPDVTMIVDQDAAVLLGQEI